ncbi:hypothetical protein L1049_023479 [Liquidambar formosana]|uniref:Uncharacterized protein n=1 Tax=Liquidambar formosana TaxID=63359 RepID=A0AAP0RU12_LIQFO
MSGARATINSGSFSGNRPIPNLGPVMMASVKNFVHSLISHCHSLLLVLHHFPLFDDGPMINGRSFPPIRRGKVKEAIMKDFANSLRESYSLLLLLLHKFSHFFAAGVKLLLAVFSPRVLVLLVLMIGSFKYWNFHTLCC